MYEGTNTIQRPSNENERGKTFISKTIGIKEAVQKIAILHEREKE